jgi:hypothetical protein
MRPWPCWPPAQIGGFQGLDLRIGSLGMGQLLGGALALAALATLGWFLHRWWLREYGERLGHSPKALFRSLCQAHGLSRSSRQLLWKLAEHQGLENPCLLFLEPPRFNPDALGPELAAHAGRLSELRWRLFEERAEE